MALTYLYIFKNIEHIGQCIVSLKSISKYFTTSTIDFYH